MAVKRLLLRQGTKAGGGVKLCECEHVGDAYNEFAGVDLPNVGPTNYNSYADDATIVSQAITITEACCVLVVGTIIAPSTQDVTDFELERPLGTIVVNQEDETPTNNVGMFHYSSWETLPPGTYTYFLVNRSGVIRIVLQAHLKILAFECTGPPCGCQYHTHVSNRITPLTATSYASDYDNFAEDAVILSQAINLTEESCVFVVGQLWTNQSLAWFELERPLGTIVVDQEEQIDSDIMRLLHYAAWEVLPAGVHTYFLVNRDGLRPVDAAQLKIIAVRCV